MFLSKYDFAEIIKKTPLISIDLCIVKGRDLLLGKRLNPPAKDFYFVPGGRIYKSELKKNSLKRILGEELGLSIKNNYEKFILDLGSYEHFYDNNFMGNKDFGTHYVVLAYLIPYELLIVKREKILNEQHSKYIWMDLDKIKESSLNIHLNTMEYLKNPILKNFNINS